MLVLDADPLRLGSFGRDEPLDEVQRQVDSRCDAASGDDVAVVDHALIGPDVGSRQGEVVECGAVRHRRAARQQACGGDDHATGTDRRDDRAGRVRLGDRRWKAPGVDGAPNTLAPASPPAARDDQQPARVDREGAVDPGAQAVIAGDVWLGALERDQPDREPGADEDLKRGDGVEFVEAVEEQDLSTDGHGTHPAGGRQTPPVAEMPILARILPTLSAPLHRVVALALPGVVLLDLAAPTHLFGHCGTGRYDFSVAGFEAGPVASSTGLELFATHGLEACLGADTLIVPGISGHSESPDPAVLDALRQADARGARIMSICTGAFALAFAGLLDGRRATTHWYSAAELADRFPEVQVDPDVLYVDEGRVLTSAGVASGIDLCLHVVRRDHGAAVAAAMARRTVVAPHRDGGQAQFVRRPIGTAAAAEAPRAAGLESTRAWAIERLSEPLDVAALATHASVSERTFARRFREETGTTPARWLTDQRIAAAQALLERTDLPVEEVATESGFGSAASLREHFARRIRTTPTAYRRAFRTQDAIT